MDKTFEERLQELESEITELKNNALTVETIKQGNATIRKYSDGRMKILYAKNVNTEINNKQTVVYTSPQIELPDFPEAFVSTPEVQISMDKAEGQWFCWHERLDKPSRTNPGKVILIRDSSTGTQTKVVTVTFHIQADGYWK